MTRSARVLEGTVGGKSHMLAKMGATLVVCSVTGDVNFMPCGCLHQCTPTARCRLNPGRIACLGFVSDLAASSLACFDMPAALACHDTNA